MANFTKQAIKASFMKLLNQKPLSKISVRDIVEDCGINRNSFYYHFQDIPSLLGEIVTEQTDELIRQYPTISSMEECFSVAFHTARENRRAVMHIFNSANRDMFLQDTMRLCEYVVDTYLTTVFFRAFLFVMSHDTAPPRPAVRAEKRDARNSDISLYTSGFWTKRTVCLSPLTAAGCCCEPR